MHEKVIFYKALLKFTIFKSKVIIANTVKGKGVPFMEGAPTWHGSVAMTASQLKEALRSLGATHVQIDKILRKEEIR